MSQAPRLTPMYEQYVSIKETYPDALLMYRMGDFYEMFFQDAEVAARELQLTLTSRNKDDAVPMCGVPWHALESYITQLVAKGYNVAVCDQVEDPRQAKGLVKRQVTRVVTAGTVLEDANLQAKSHNYLAALFWNPDRNGGGLAWVDVSTGQWTGLQSARLPDLWQWVQKLTPRELLVWDEMEVPQLLTQEREIKVARLPYRSHFEPKRALNRVLTAQKVGDAATLGLDKRPELLQACGALLAYVEQNQMQDPAHLAPFKPMDLGRHLILDEVTERNLELLRRMDGKKGVGTLRHVLDLTRTPMGGRLLEERLRYPWRDAETILKNQEAVAWLVEGREGTGGAAPRAALRLALDTVYDLERLSTRIFLGRCQPRDLLALRQSLLSLPGVYRALFLTTDGYADGPQAKGDFMPPALHRLVKQWDNLSDLAGLLEKALLDELPLQVTEGNLFRQGYDPRLDEWLDLVEHGEGKLQELLAQEQEQSRLPKLKMGFNRVFGYYFELTKAGQTAPIPEHFSRKQSLANAERFSTPALKELEEKLLEASDARKSLEYQLFQELREKVAAARPRLLFMGDMLAQLDYWQALAEAAERGRWCRPEIHDGQELTIREGRHPVVEEVIGAAHFIPNDLHMDEQRRLLLITGPNMAGKSTVLRQTALICLMAQMGSYVPAAKARLGLVDRIFSRVGASDNLAQGQSTFMVEMMETARILRQGNRRSLVILDEIGRGTSTFDGLSLAWAVVEELARTGCRTLFATHYHELTGLEGRILGVHNMNIAIREWNKEIIFLRRLIPGPADKSYGIEVARLAGVPLGVVNRAKEVLAQLEKQRPASAGQVAQQVSTQASAGLLPGISLPEKPARPEPEIKAVPVRHPLQVALDDVDVDNLSPMAALKLLAEWKLLWGGPVDDGDSVAATASDGDADNLES